MLHCAQFLSIQFVHMSLLQLLPLYDKVTPTKCCTETELPAAVVLSCFPSRTSLLLVAATACCQTSSCSKPGLSIGTELVGKGTPRILHNVRVRVAYNVMCTLHNLHYTLSGLHTMLPYTMYFTFQTATRTVHTLFNTLHMLPCAQCVLCPLHCALYTLHTPHCTLCTLHTPHTAYCTLHTAHCTLNHAPL